MKNLTPFVDALRNRLNDYKQRVNLTYFREYDVQVETGRRYHKIFRVEVPHDASKLVAPSIVAFVDIESGAIYKPASFKAPAKHVRGFVDSPEHGMEAVGPSGFVHYMR